MADSSHNDVYEDDIVEDVFIDSDAPVAEVATDFDLSLGTVAAPLHRTSLGTPHELDLVYWPPQSPWAPYDTESFFGIQTNMGLYVWGTSILPDDAIEQNNVAECFPTLVEVSPVNFRSTALGRGLLGSVTAVDRPTAFVVIEDHSGFFRSRFDLEIFAGMPAGLWKLVHRIWLIPRLTGTIGPIEYDLGTNRVTIPYGHYARQEP